MPAQYNRAGIQFEYPENWQLTDDQFADSAHYVSLESPGGGYWSLQVFPRWVDPEAASDEVRKTLLEEYESLESVEAKEQIDDIEATGYDMHFYCLDFVVACKTRSFYAGGKTFVVVYQAEDRDFDQLEPVFQAMMISLLRRSTLGNR